MVQLIQKYNKAIPRYTSYPTVPHWELKYPQQAEWLNEVQKIYFSQEDKSISLYIHLPFCESLCTYCGCNKRITKKHEVEDRYIDALLAEWAIYMNNFGEAPIIRNLHLGGGTPTFFSASNLNRLLKEIITKASIHPQKAFSFEGHPNNTTYAQLEVLANLGFDRVSYGIQDFDEQVQKAIHRLQPIENVENVTVWARELGYESINYDLIYGLPFQSLASISNTISQIRKFMPERIALYSYAHVPWKSKAQRGYKEQDLPSPELKLAMYQTAKKQLNDLGYINVGMDHFAMPKDELTLAKNSGSLNRNFMGYTTDQNQLMLGLGCSSISSTGSAFVQSEKQVEKYQHEVISGQLPLIIGHFLKDQEKIVAKHINSLICNGVGDFSESQFSMSLFEQAKESLIEMEGDGLLSLDGYYIQVTEKGMLFVRNICSLFDPKLRKKEAIQQFSQSI